MPVTLRSYAKINLGLAIGPRRKDGFHELGTVYQTIALHDVLKLEISRGAGIEIRCSDARVPTDELNTCWRMAEAMLRALKIQRRITVSITKRLPLQGGLGGASSNAVATMLGLEREFRRRIPLEKKQKLAAQVGSDLPLFLIGGTVMGRGRGETVAELPDLPPLFCVVVTPELGVSTPAAFAAWDRMAAGGRATPVRGGRGSAVGGPHTVLIRGLTAPAAFDKIRLFSRRLGGRLRGTASGVPGSRKARDRAEALLLDLVRAGIENDFEAVVFPQHPELREVKKLLVREGAGYASLSGSGSAVYGLFASRRKAAQVAARLRAKGLAAQATRTLSRREYWRMI